MAFYENAKKISKSPYPFDSMCANEKIDMASQACCVPPINAYSHASYDCKFTGERVKYSTAKDRCQSSGDVCDWLGVNSYGEAGCEIYGNHNWFWTSNNCEILVKGKNTNSVECD